MEMIGFIAAAGLWSLVIAGSIYVLQLEDANIYDHPELPGVKMSRKD